MKKFIGFCINLGAGALLIAAGLVQADVKTTHQLSSAEMSGIWGSACCKEITEDCSSADECVECKSSVETPAACSDEGKKYAGEDFTGCVNDSAHGDPDTTCSTSNTTCWSKVDCDDNGVSADTICIVGSHQISVAGVGDKELLKLVVDLGESNQNQLTSWQGTALVELQKKHSDSTRWNGAYVAEIDFVLDRTAEATRWNWNYLKQLRTLGDKTVTHPAPGFKNGMRTNDAYYEYEMITPHDVDEDKKYRLAIRDKKAAENEMYADSFDPVWYYGFHNTLHTDRIKSLYENWDEGKWEVKRDEDMVSLKYDVDGVINHYIFDLKQGGQLVQYTSVDPYVENVWDYDFEFLDGVWAIKTVNRSNLRKYEDGEVRKILTSPR